MSELESLPRAVEKLDGLRHEIEKHFVGHESLVRGILAGLVAGGHVLLEGVPGLGKTLVVKTLSDALGLAFSRIQFTPDLMPADVIGTQMAIMDETGQRQFQFQPGPVFTQILLADEINRATPKTQSALLEAMEERTVTVGREEHRLDVPFMVLATQNPIEMEGTYPLPEAQLDRFLLKLTVGFPDAETLREIADRSLAPRPPAVESVLNVDELVRMQQLVRAIVLAEHVKDYAIRLILATHASTPNAPAATVQYVRHGSSPRGLLAIILIAKAFAMFDGRLNVSFEDIRAAAAPALRHRVLLNFEAQAEGVEIDALITGVINSVPVSELVDVSK